MHYKMAQLKGERYLESEARSCSDREQKAVSFIFRKESLEWSFKLLSEGHSEVALLFMLEAKQVAWKLVFVKRENPSAGTLGFNEIQLQNSAELVAKLAGGIV